MSTKLEVWGDYACFTRPELKTERVSYPVMTPSAARGIIDAIYWHPGMRNVIDKIHVLSPIDYMNVRVNEVASKISWDKVREHMIKRDNAPLYIDTTDGKKREQRSSRVLKNVHYVIESHFELVPEKMNEGDNKDKFKGILAERIEAGRCYKYPYFGMRQFPVFFRKWEEKEIPTAYPDKVVDFGLMIYDHEFRKDRVNTALFHAVMENGVIDLTKAEVLK